METRDLKTPLDVVDRARIFATAAHAAVGQKRKYTGEPYIVHPAEVVEILRGRSYTTPEMLAAAWLHDVLEDTQVNPMDLDAMFGRDISLMVVYLTDVPRDYGNRETRKAADLRRLSDAPFEVQTIKVADMISNTSTIVKYDPNFAKVYLQEKAALLDAMTKADPVLVERARTHL